MEGTKFIVRKKYEFQQGDLYFSVDLLGTFVPLEFRSKKKHCFFFTFNDFSPQRYCIIITL